MYSEFYRIHTEKTDSLSVSDCIIVEDSNSGYEFFSKIAQMRNITCISAGGNSNIFAVARDSTFSSLLVVADGAAFGAEIEKLLELYKCKNIAIYLPESFEWLILSSGIVDQVKEILDNPHDHIESRDYFTWEQFFTHLLIEKTDGTYLKFQKAKLNPNYLQSKILEKIIAAMPSFDLKE